MKIATKFLGEVEIDEQDILTFKLGLLGLEEFKKFILIPISEEHPLVLLQSIEQEDIGFVVAYPFAFKKTTALN